MLADLVPTTHLSAWYLSAGPGTRGPVMLLADRAENPRTAVSVERFVAGYFHAEGWNVMRCEHPPIAHLYASLGGLMPPHPATQGRQLSPIDYPTHGIYPDRLTDVALGRAHALIPPLSTDREHLHQVVQTYWQRTADARSYLAGEVVGEYDLIAEEELHYRRVRQLINIFHPAGLLRLMDWLRPDFFAHRRGWPDLLIWRTDAAGTITDHRFVEVKSRRDRWSPDQKDLIAANTSHGFGMNIHLVKVDAAGEIPRPSDADLGLTDTYPGNRLPGRRPLAPLWPVGLPEPTRALAT